MLSQHVLDRYQHSMRYFGLLAPRAKRTTSAAVFLLLGQKQRYSPAAPELAKLFAPRLPHRSPPRQPRPAIALGPLPPADIGLAFYSRANDTADHEPQLRRLTARSDISF